MKRTAKGGTVRIVRELMIYNFTVGVKLFFSSLREQWRYKRLIYQRSRSNTPFSVENFATKPPPVPRSSRDSRKKGDKFTCKNCGTINVSRQRASSTGPQKIQHEDTTIHRRRRKSDTRHNRVENKPTESQAKGFRAWCAATKSKLVENASLMWVLIALNYLSNK